MKTLKYNTSTVKALEIDQRESAAKRGYGSRWQTARKQYLMQNPLCVDCEKHNLVTAARVVDHIVPHQGDQTLFWDRENWQGLCKSHHSQKTAGQDGGFGNRQLWKTKTPKVSTLIGKINR